jgi:hypothetical protein
MEVGIMSFQNYQRAVSNQLYVGYSLGEVEGFIEASALDEEQKAALWLWAWGHQTPDVQRSFKQADLQSLEQAWNRF